MIGRPMEILLIEDGLLDARLTIAALKKSGLHHRLTLFRDGEEALDSSCTPANSPARCAPI